MRIHRWDVPRIITTRFVHRSSRYLLSFPVFLSTLLFAVNRLPCSTIPPLFVQRYTTSSGFRTLFHISPLCSRHLPQALDRIINSRYLIFIWRNRWMRLLSRIIQFAGEKFVERLTNIFFYRRQTLNVSIPKQHNETFKQSKFRQSKHFRAKQRESLVRRILRSGPQLFICINRKRESVKFHGMHEERIKYPEYSVFVWYLYTCLTVFSKIWISLKIRSQPENNW